MAYLRMAENRYYIGYAMFKHTTLRHTGVLDRNCVKIKLFFTELDLLTPPFTLSIKIRRA